VDVRRIILTPRPLGRRPFVSIPRVRRRALVVGPALCVLAFLGLFASGGLTGASGIPTFSAVSFRTSVDKSVPQATNGAVTTTSAPVVAAVSSPPPPPPPPATPPPVQPDVDTASAAAWAASPGVACIREAESGDNYAEDTGNGYYGAYQDALSTWENAGGTGLPSDAPPAVQDQINYQIYLSGGWGQWSTAAGCGL
jgi:hypothetical protein